MEVAPRFKLLTLWTWGLRGLRGLRGTRGMRWLMGLNYKDKYKNKVSPSSVAHGRGRNREEANACSSLVFGWMMVIMIYNQDEVDIT